MNTAHRQTPLAGYLATPAAPLPPSSTANADADATPAGRRNSASNDLLYAACATLLLIFVAWLTPVIARADLTVAVLQSAIPSINLQQPVSQITMPGMSELKTADKSNTASATRPVNPPVATGRNANSPWVLLLLPALLAVFAIVGQRGAELLARAVQYWRREVRDDTVINEYENVHGDDDLQDEQEPVRRRAA